MADKTHIEWSEATWNPTTGCDRVSEGCTRCYALTLAKRLKAMGSPKYQTDGDPKTSGPGFGLAMHPDTLDLPLSWRKPRRVFVNSMSDLFHEKVSDEYIARVFGVMAVARQHTFQVLTKRHGRMRSLLSSYRWWTSVVAEALEYGQPGPTQTQPDGGCALLNVHLVVSAENQHWADIRIPALLDTPAAVRGVSLEPLLGAVNIGPYLTRVGPCSTCDGSGSIAVPGGGHACPACDWTYRDRRSGGVDWVITGGESGPGFRPANPDWFRQIRDQCVDAGVAYLHKQNGGIRPKANGRLLDGRTWDEYPVVAP
jgi:protein gp37